MPKTSLFSALLATAVVLVAVALAHAQSPYGLASRQTIPFVVTNNDDRGLPTWDSEINIFNPGALSETVNITYFGAVPTATPGALPCKQQVVGSGQTLQLALSTLCALNPGPNYGRLELTSLGPGASGDPGDLAFMTNARVTRAGRYFTVEGFPQGNLSGNRSFAAVTGLKSGNLGGAQWKTTCYAAALNESAPVYVKLVDGSGLPVGGFTAAPLDPPSLKEMQVFFDVFAAVGAPPGNYDNVTALFSTNLAGGVGGAGVFGFCSITNMTTGQVAFEIAKYTDNSDEGRQHTTVVSRSRFGALLAVAAEVSKDDKRSQTNVHVAYFQHPDRVSCRVRYGCSFGGLCTFDQVQIRLIDPDDNVVAGGPRAQSFTFDMGEKSAHHNGTNGRWLVEVAPDSTYWSGGGLYQGGLDATPYTLTCSSGNGHNQLDIIGHCGMTCHAGGGGNAARCEFDSPFDPKACLN
jgi:hypothetical protein